MSQTSIQVQDQAIGELLRKGLRLPHEPQSGLVILLRGMPGTGKSTLAIQLLEILAPARDTKKYYLTVEQTADDLNFKRAFMKVAKAVDDSRRIIHNNKEPGRIRCLSSQLYNSFKGFRLPSYKTEGYLSGLQWPLDGEQTDPQLHACNKALRSLAERVAKNRGFASQIDIDGMVYTERPRSTEQPLGRPENRVLAAIQKLEKYLDPKRSKLSIPREKRPIIVIDGLSMFSASERELLQLQTIVHSLRSAAQVGILVYEPNANESVSLDHHADMVIELTSRALDQYLIHELTITKSRYQEAALGNHQFKIRASGIAVFPSLHFQVHHHNYMDLELLRTTNPEQKPLSPEQKPTCPKLNKFSSLIDVIFNPRPGDATVLLGHRGAFKTELCLDFVGRGHWGCPIYAANPSSALLISLIDNAPNTDRLQKCPWAGCGPSKECIQCNCLLSHVRTFRQRPGCITSAEFLYYINRCIRPKATDQPTVQRVLFWDLTQMDYRFPLFKRDPMLLPALLDTFKSSNLTSLFMGAANADNTEAASAMADNVLFCWRSLGKSHSPEKTDDKNKITGNEEDKADYEPHLMLYVDRTSAETPRYGKCLYRIPINKQGKLSIPDSKHALQDIPYRLTPDTYRLHLSEADQNQIDHFNNMQGSRPKPDRSFQ